MRETLSTVAAWLDAYEPTAFVLVLVGFAVACYLTALVLEHWPRQESPQDRREAALLRDLVVGPRVFPAPGTAAAAPPVRLVREGDEWLGSDASAPASFPADEATVIGARGGWQ